MLSDPQSPGGEWKEENEKMGQDAIYRGKSMHVVEA